MNNNYRIGEKFPTRENPLQEYDIIRYAAWRDIWPSDELEAVRHFVRKELGVGNLTSSEAFYRLFAPVSMQLFTQESWYSVCALVDKFKLENSLDHEPILVELEVGEYDSATVEFYLCGYVPRTTEQIEEYDQALNKIIESENQKKAQDLARRRAKLEADARKLGLKVSLIKDQ